MALVLIGAPALEPVSVAEAKTHLRVESEAENALIASLIVTSRLHVEAALGLALLTQRWRLSLDRWPKERTLALPLRPLQSIDAVRVLPSAGDAHVVEPSNYLVDVASVPPRLVRRAALPVPGLEAGGIEIEFTCGFGDSASDVPAPIRQAILLLVAHWYEHRDPIEVGSADTAVPAVVSELLAPYRIARL